MWKACGIVVAVAAAVAGIWVVTAQPSDARTSGVGSLADTTLVLGREVTILPRRDTIGMAAEQPPGLLATEVSGRRLAVTGTLRAVEAEWLIVESDGKMVWVARDAILAIVSK